MAGGFVLEKGKVVKQVQDHVGERWGRLVILARAKGKSDKKSYWLCQCDCGSTTIVYYGSLKCGNTKSCGCMRKEWTKYMGESNRLEYGESSFYYVYDYYVRSAKKRGISFHLDIHYFRMLTTKNCFYCGAEPSNLASNRKAYGDYVYTGVDRVHNDLGYTADNCVPCCKDCNRAKLVMGYEEFMKWLSRIYWNVYNNNLDSLQVLEEKIRQLKNEYYLET